MVKVGRIKIRISEDKLAASARIEPGDPAGETELREALAATNVVHGIDESVVERLASALADAEFAATDECIATGDAPKPGTDGRLELAFQPGIQAGTLRPDGTLDFWERELLKPIKQDGLVATYYPAQPGEAGTTVTGEPKEARAGKEHRVPLGQGLTELPTGEIVATKDGVIEYTPKRRLEVISHLEHRGDVDMRSGNLDMQGYLVVRGDIKTGFVARASGDVEVKGTIDGGSLLAGGSAKIGGGVLGSERSSVCVNGSLAVRHAQSAELYCGEELHCSANLVNSQTQARSVSVGKQLSGGETRAESSITVKDVGSASRIETVLAVGERLEPCARLSRFAPKKSESDQESASRRVRGPRGGEERSATAKNARLRRDEMRPEAKPGDEETLNPFDLLREARIEIRGTAYPGVTVYFGRRRVTFNKKLRALRLRLNLDKGAIVKERL